MADKRAVTSPQNGRKGGRPPVVWDNAQCEMFKGLCRIFCTEEEICSVMGVSSDLLVRLINRHLYEDVTGHKLLGRAKRIGFAEAFKKYSSGGKMSLRRKQMDVALAGDHTMLIWLGKQHLDQRDEPATEVNVDAAPKFYFDRSEIDA